MYVSISTVDLVFYQTRNDVVARVPKSVLTLNSRRSRGFGWSLLLRRFPHPLNRPGSADSPVASLLACPDIE